MKTGTKALIFSMISNIMAFACSKNSETIAALFPRISIAVPARAARKIICKGFPSKKGVKKLSGTIPRTISRSSESRKELLPLPVRGNKGRMAMPNTVVKISVIHKNLLIIRFPTFPSVAISPIL